MYIFRGKNRRDHRNLLTSSPLAVWGTPKEDYRANDALLRWELEQKHVEYFVKRIHQLMYQYLNTDNGKKEVSYIVSHLESRAAKALADEIENETDPDKRAKLKLHKTASIAPEALKKKNIYEVFRKYDSDGSGNIDMDELRVLLTELNVPMKDEELRELMSELDADNEGGIDFEEFYTWFVNAADAQRSKNRWSYFKSAAKGGVFNGFKRLILEVEARNLLIDVAVSKAKHGARVEYRIAHPADFYCDICHDSFASNKELQLHSRDTDYHDSWLVKSEEDRVKYSHVDAIFNGEEGRHLNANRLMFSSELIPMEERVKAVTSAPFRPNTLDPGGKKLAKMLGGAFISGGNDAKSGIRTQFKKLGLWRQHHSASSRSNQLQLTNMLSELNNTRDEKVDVITAKATSTHTSVKLYYNGDANLKIFIVGEFNNWKPHPLLNDNVLGKCYYGALLCPGRYRYCFVVDGQRVVDTINSSITDSYGTYNVILVVNPTSINDPAYSHFQGIKHLNLRNLALNDDGSWAFSAALQVNSTIESIDLSHNSISDDGIMAIAESLHKLKNVNHLNVSGNGFGNDGCRYLVQVFRKCSSITRLDLASNRLGDDGCQVIAEGLIKHHSSIQYLNLDSNLISDDGMTYLGEALEKNRTLLHLSLNENLCFAAGAERLSYYLQWNAVLLELHINNNPLGPQGVKHIGDMLTANNTIQHLDLSNVELVRSKYSTGLMAITFGLTKCRSLTSLSLRNNDLDDDNVAELGQLLSTNKYIVQLDLTGNRISNKWFQPNTFLLTKLMRDMPSIRTSLDRNLEIKSNPMLASKYNSVKKQSKRKGNGSILLNQDYEGQWTHLRQWQEVNKKAILRQRLKLEGSAEQSRIDEEKEYIQEHMMKHLTVVEQYLNNPSGRKTLSVIAKMITDHFKSIATLQPDDPPPPPVPVPMTLTEYTKMKYIEEGYDIDDEGDNIGNKRLRGALARARAERIEEDFAIYLTQWVEENELIVQDAQAKIHAYNEYIEKKKIESLVVLNDTFYAFHNTVMSTVFRDCGADEKYLLLHPETLQLLFQRIALPILPEHIQKAADETIVPIAWKIGCKKFSKYLIDNAKAIADSNHTERKRILFDLYFNPPLREAKLILLFHEEHAIKMKLMKEYREIKGKEPEYECAFCMVRFASAKAYQKHKDKKGGSEHKRYSSSLILHSNRTTFLRHAKYLITNSKFPTFYELIPEKDQPLNYFPQIFDHLGDEGRPIGVIEPNVTIRVQDCLGEYLQVCYGDQLGWTKLRGNFGWRGTYTLLRPALSSVNNFTWEGLKMIEWGKCLYYKVVDDIPAATEIKVRLQPLLEAEVCGHLMKNQVVQVGAIFNDWIQIKYNHIAAAWVLYVAGGGGTIGSSSRSEGSNSKLLLEELNAAQSRKLSLIMNRSPYNIVPKDLIPDPIIEKNYIEQLELLKDAAGDDYINEDDEDDDGEETNNGINNEEKNENIRI